jgi:hypothetical protein
MMIFLVSGLFLLGIGGLVSILFWVPGLVDRRRLRELLGPRYPMIYLVYSANGPLLVLAGGILLFKYLQGG